MEMPVKLIVFDLDDTLFPEREYVCSGFRHIARLIADAGTIPADEIFEFLLMTTDEPQSRGQSINRLVESYPSSIGRNWTVDTLVQAYRCHRPSIDFYPGVWGALETLRRCEIGLGVITDGAPDSQRRKLQALGLLEAIPAVVITDEFGVEYRKPSIFAYSRLSSLFELSPECCLYVGDNPAKDFFGARLLGWKTLRLRMTGQYHEFAEAVSPEFEPNAEVTNIETLKHYLLELVVDQTVTTMCKTQEYFFVPK